MKTYLEKDWELPEAWRSRAAKDGPKHAHLIAAEAAKFLAYYADAFRDDWETAWQRWWLKALERPPGKRGAVAKDVTVHDTSEPFEAYRERMVREGKFKMAARD